MKKPIEKIDMVSVVINLKKDNPDEYNSIFNAGDDETRYTHLSGLINNTIINKVNEIIDIINKM